MLTQLHSCHHLSELDLYVRMSCKSKGEISLEIGEDSLCQDHMYEVDVTNGNCV